MTDMNEEVLRYLKMIDDLGYSKKLNLGLRETARLVGVTPPTIDSWRKQGLIEGLVVGGKVLFPKLKIAEFQVSYTKTKQNKDEKDIPNPKDET